MERIGQQLLELFLGALPTTIIVFLLFFFLRWAFWRPLERVLAERAAATEGARREAEETLSSAEEKLRQYEETLRQARAQVYREQEANRRQALDERARVLRETRENAAQMLRQAKREIARDVEQAKKELEAESQRLAEQITDTLLTPPASVRGRRPGGEPA